jgi:hypothetical protein
MVFEKSYTTIVHDLQDQSVLLLLLNSDRACLAVVSRINILDESKRHDTASS